MAKNKGGRPKIVFNEKQFASIDYMCIIHCTGEEIAGVMGVDYDTLNRIISEKYGMSFSDYYKTKSAQGKMSLRRMQWKSAEDGNVAMQMFLGKQMLDQRDVKDKETNDYEAKPDVFDEIAKRLKGGN